MLSNNLAETVLISYNLLPAKEVDIIRSSLYQSPMKLGFHSGVYHVEAQDSALHDSNTS